MFFIVLLLGYFQPLKIIISMLHIKTVVQKKHYFIVDLPLKMLDMYLLDQNCLHLTSKPYLSSETYSRKYKKLPNIVVHACKILQK